MTEVSALEQIAQTVADWGDGWRFLMDPESHGRRARLVREPHEGISVEIELAMDGAERFVHALARALADGDDSSTVDTDEFADVEFAVEAR